VGCKVAAPPFRRYIVSAYRPQGVVFLGIGTNDPGTAGSTRLFAEDFNWDFPCALDPGNVYRNYETRVENFMVIGPDGKIKFRAAGTGTYRSPWSTIEAPLKQAIENALVTPVQEETWGRLKAFYR
jgi:hypothetical protein